MKAVGIIPARYKATRFKGKVLAPLCGKPVIQHVWEKAKGAHNLDDLIIAADDNRIIKGVESFGGKATLTSKQHLSGTDRLKEIANPLDVDVVVNIQADEPLIRPAMIDELVRALFEDRDIVMATLMKKIDNPEDINNPNVVKVIVDKDNFALYFSRTAIPFCEKGTAPFSPQIEKEQEKRRCQFFKHIGLYSYTKDFLFTFANLPPSSLERAEGLEQLRALENGYKIKVLETAYDTVGIDTPEDLTKAEEMLSKEIT
ncbi:MAG: 3-deoxy-manno-octulosonate cytidylyltransferase [Candidatus Omnitrophota bacterium]|nr:MAG: 3-deoxy-manno-octulosonate cytidylyltransferase [Candidatus Omnitrophota bacterium]